MNKNLIIFILTIIITFVIVTLFVILSRPVPEHSLSRSSDTQDSEIVADGDIEVSDSFVLATDIVIPELEITSVVSGLDHPWDIGFLPSGEIVFTERSNKLNIFRDGAIVKTFNFADAYVQGEGGVLGLSVDPQFELNNYLYVCLNSSLGNNPEVRVARLKLNSTNKEILERTDIVTAIPSNSSGRHSGCQLEFDTFGDLWIGTGDIAIGTNPQDPGSLAGKILRVDRDGNGVAGNLDAPFDPRIFSYGHRNVQGLAFFPKELGFVGLGISVEQGPGSDDEVNMLSPGNYGWNPVPGYNESVPMTDKESFPDAHEAIFSTPGRTFALSGGTVIFGEQWGSLQGVIVAAALKDEKLTLIRTDKNGKFLTTTNILEGAYGRIRTAQTAPDGSIYFLTDNGGNDSIYRMLPK